MAKSGDVPVVAAASGTVSKSYYSDSYGNVVFIRHTINGTQYETVYAHLRSRAVSEGQTVSQGQFIGYMGNTGESFGQHLHFEIHKPYWTFRQKICCRSTTISQFIGESGKQSV
ncbi:M23 family metallopeptidase [Saccharococcus caldoxylosilyticus]|uniref:M23 family metallopeptidase n=1 Tax=Saccharococcus caldoxylosilyticus TaxID=81408 RepID=UPI001FCADC0F|nr:M23 family metallopeptidase [Parageobacillus caldoxylosilyticus]